ncbi:TetR/AcrR family transcriptional regulator [Mycolicibacillus trivialis]|uniref:TetR family transcriptional regulator n=1 Tax=Mycolicibacillus trivialis TaxID=1798 RepID=A0A1X2EMX3_9MYCO|nr:TetR/AcrR family transcriptional regulator [Mycolicibacillus trivialis]ORX06999.1 TetR family transcriptional regulator [Mycolicibacillus trivialis]
MAISDRRARYRAARRDAIVAAARRLAAAEGWEAVTTRRLAAAVEYSQPVLYAHFGCMDELVAAVALEGFGELAEALRAAGAGASSGAEALRRLAAAYVGFAVEHPALYDAMFTRSSTLHFGAEDTPAALTDAFAALREVVALVAGTADVDTYAEVVWAALHGLVTLDRDHRLRPGYVHERLDLLVAALVPG